MQDGRYGNGALSYTRGVSGLAGHDLLGQGP